MLVRNPRGRLILWWALMDSNHRPTDYESAALTAVLRAQALHNKRVEAAYAASSFSTVGESVGLHHSQTP